MHTEIYMNLHTESNFWNIHILPEKKKALGNINATNMNMELRY